MFFILTFLNIPIYVLYEQNTKGNDWGEVGKLFKFFTIGNLGQLTKKCGFSNMHWYFHATDPNLDQHVTVDCGNGYIGEIQQFGFLYEIDKVYGGKSDGEATCNNIMDPTASYKIPPPVVITCSEDDLDDQGYDLCEVERRFSIGELTEEEYLQENRVVKNSYLPDDERLPDDVINEPL